MIYWTGARMSDAIRLGSGMVCSDGWISFKQQKTGGEVSIPFDRVLPDFTHQSDLTHLHATIAKRPAKHMTFIVTSFGASRSHKGASQWFAKATRNVGISGKSAHGLRKSRAIALAENGATTHQIAVWTGHESLSEVEHYSRAAKRKRILSGTETEQKLSKNDDL